MHCGFRGVLLFPIETFVSTWTLWSNFLDTNWIPKWLWLFVHFKNHYFLVMPNECHIYQVISVVAYVMVIAMKSFWYLESFLNELSIFFVWVFLLLSVFDRRDSFHIVLSEFYTYRITFLWEKMWRKMFLFFDFFEIILVWDVIVRG